MHFPQRKCLYFYLLARYISLLTKLSEFNCMREKCNSIKYHLILELVPVKQF